MAIVKHSEYKGRPIISIARDDEDRFPFQFGLAKAKLVLDNLGAVRKFVEKYDSSEEESNGKPKSSKKKAKARRDDDEE